MLAGFREMPKFCLVMVFAKMRALLWPIGKELEQAGLLTDASDIFFITHPEIDEAVAGKDMRQVVSERRADYEREQQRKRIPRVLLSDGTEPGLLTHTQNMAGEQLRGTSASPGQVTARARVIFDPTGAHLEPGEVLVAPSTDPGWTPLFLTASALVMEMGGMMSHGAVVAREYGIPAIVGVEGATERIMNGATVTVDGTKGTVTISENDHAERTT
jgi:pyruvate,water dikinase